MKYYVHKLTGELKQGWSALKDWVALPPEYQDKFFEDIRSCRADVGIFIAHRDLNPERLFGEKWVTAGVVKKGTMVYTDKEGLVGFKQPWPSPTEQRDAFQKQYPHLVKKIKGFEHVDTVDTSPKHYRQGAIEPWDFITSQGMNFLEGNIVKYVTRYKAKGGIADLLKAKTYLEKLIKEVVKCENSKD